MASPSQDIANELARLITDQTRKSFLKKYGAESDYYDESGKLIQGLRPDEMFSAVGEERVNPEQLRTATSSILAYDRNFNRGGGYLSGRMKADRSAYVAGLERARKEAVNQYTESQKDLFNRWYNQEMYNYQTSEAPSEYQLNKFGIQLPTAMPEGQYKLGQEFSYKPAFEMTDLFRYGGYRAAPTMFNLPTPV